MAIRSEGGRVVIDDIEALRFSYETHLFSAIKGRFGPVPLMNHSESRQLLDQRRRDLLGDAVRVTGDLLPQVHPVYQECMDVLGGGYTGDLFVRQSPEYNASVFAHENRFDILIHSALLNDFSLNELRFVFGHELGHVAFRHSLFPVHHLVELIKGQDPEGAVLLLRWSRAAEISADRLGMLCCGQLCPATTALFRTASGLSGIDETLSLQALRNQFSELEIQMRSTKPSGWVRTHPMIPIRFKAIELASLDLIALKSGTGAFSAKGFQRIDHLISSILEKLDIQPQLPR